MMIIAEKQSVVIIKLGKWVVGLRGMGNSWGGCGGYF